MRQRITFLHKPEHGVDPATIKVTDNSLTGPVVPALREDRLTLALDELPDELRQVLQTCHELHIRWVSPYAYDTISPLFSRLSPGFHLFYTPAQDSHSLDDGQLCAALQKAFGPLDCDTPKTSFTTLPNDRFSHSTAYQYYAPLDTLTPFITYAHSTLCPPPSSVHPEASSCTAHVDRLSVANSLDISYDTISHALKVIATWGVQDQPLIVTSPFDKTKQEQHRVEVGVLGGDTPRGIEAHELGLAGFLTVLGQDKKPSATMFKFPARHQRVGGVSFRTKVLEPTGLHPTVRIEVDADGVKNEVPTGPECALHAYLTLPRTLFADKYQLSDPLFLASKNITALRYMTQPVDLEAPEYVTGQWGSATLLELSSPATAGGPWTAEVPLHLRYLSPASGGYKDIEVPYPAVFWACTTEEGTKFPSSPFERVNLGYDGLFGPRTVFWHVDPQPHEAGGRLMNKIRVPVLDVDKSQWVSTGTAVVVLIGFAWIVWKLLVVYLKTGYGPEKQMKGLEKKKQ